MIKRIISTALAVSTLLLCTVGVSAAVVTDDEGSAITLSGVVPTKQAGVSVGIDVFCPDKDYTDLRAVTPSEIKKVMVMRNQVESGENGEWSLEFKIVDDPDLDYDARSGNYTAVIYPQDSQAAYKESFSYVNLKAAESVLDSIVQEEADEVDTDDVENIVKLMNEGKADLGIDYDFSDKTFVTEAAELLLAEVKDGALTDVSTAEGIAVVRRAYLSVAVCGGAVDNLFEYADELMLKDSSIKKFLDKSYIEENEAAITEGMQGKSVESFDDFDKGLSESTVLAVVKNPDGAGNVKEIVNEFSEEIGIDGSISLTEAQSIMGKSYDDFDALEKAIEDAEVSEDKGNGGSSGGGSSGGGASITANKDKEPEPMYFDIFTDIDDISWAKDAIIYLAEKNILAGKAQGLFYPDDNITRAELTKILVIAFAPDAEEADISFKDVEKTAWYYSYVAKAVDAGIVTGYSDTEFGSEDFVTRQDMVTMIYRAASAAGITLEPATVAFADEAEIADYAKEAVGALAAGGIVNGIDFNNFVPKGLSTRAQAAKVVYGLLML